MSNVLINDFQKVLWRAEAVLSYLRVAFARATGVTIGEGVVIGGSCEVALTGSVARRGVLEVGDRSEICSGTLLYPHGGSIRIANTVHVGPGCVIYGLGGIEIGEQTMLAPAVALSPPVTPFRSPALSSARSLIFRSRS